MFSEHVFYQHGSHFERGHMLALFQKKMKTYRRGPVIPPAAVRLRTYTRKDL